MNSHGGSKVLVLYNITNAKGESPSSYNAFELPGGANVSLAHAKKHCRALQKINSAGANGYHWRVRVDDKVTKPKAPLNYSWWDIQDENARLPVKEVTFTELSHILSPPRKTMTDDSMAKSVSNVTRSLGKAMNKVAASVNETPSPYDNGPRVSIVMFKLLDISKLYDSGTGPRTGRDPVAQPRTRAAPAPAPAPVQPQRQPQRQPTQKTARTHLSSQPAAPSRQATATAGRPAAKEGSLMDFGDTPTTAHTHAHARPIHTPSAPKAAERNNETRAQKLKREYAQKKTTDQRVWDDVDQRWVTVDPKKSSAANKSTASAPPGGDAAASGKPKLKGVSLDNVNLAGKSANVASAVQGRVNEMKTSQQKALKEIREREASKKKSEDEEDEVRRKLEPKIKVWSEEHGKKKQLSALLASLHTILWPGAKWKPVNLGDLLNDKKVKLNFHKASRVVHPDKTMHLESAEERFLAKRIFDALSQAKTIFDESK